MKCAARVLVFLGCISFIFFGNAAQSGAHSSSESAGVIIRRPLRASPNPNYFQDADGNPLILCGSQTWNTLQDWGTGQRSG